MSDRHFTWSRDDVDRLQRGSRVTWFKDNEAGQIEVHKLHPQTGLGGPRMQIEAIEDRWGTFMALSSCDPKTIVDPPKDHCVLVPLPEPAEMARLVRDIIGNANNKGTIMKSNKTLAMRVSDIANQVSRMSLADRATVERDLRLLERDVDEIEKKYWLDHQPNHTWSPDDLQRLVRGSQVSWRVGPYSGHGGVDHVGPAAGEDRDVVWFVGETYAPLSSCDPSTIVDAPETLERRRREERLATINMIDADSQRWLQKDRDAWNRLRNELMEDLSRPLG